MWRACTRGMRIRVIDVLDLFAAGLSAEQILQEMPDLEAEDLQAALQYAARKLDHPVLATIWIDAQISPSIAPWMSSKFTINAMAIRDLGLREAKDQEIFQAAKRENVMVMTKDSDFVLLLDRFGPPPQVIWITCGNTSNTSRRLTVAV